MENREAILELASLVAETIRRAGAQYGSPDDWRRDFTRAVRIFETLSREGANHGSVD